VDSEPVQSKSLEKASAPEARMSNVLEALSIGQTELAENLFARVSKRILAEELERHKQGALVHHPTPRRVLALEFENSEARVVVVSSRKVVADLVEPWLPSHLEIRCRSIADEVGLSFTGVDRAWLIDALSTKIVARNSGFYEFSWKQKFAVG
jgi:hypothetical protein